MEETNYEMDLLRENIHLRCFAHTIMNYRYHWHPDEYELSIVLQGTQEYCRGTETGRDFPEDLTHYDLVIHCGSCMFNRRMLVSRQDLATAQQVPMTNYGLAIAYLTGILDKVTLP